MFWRTIKARRSLCHAFSLHVSSNAASRDWSNGKNNSPSSGLLSLRMKIRNRCSRTSIHSSHISLAEDLVTKRSKGSLIHESKAEDELTEFSKLLGIQNDPGIKEHEVSLDYCDDLSVEESLLWKDSEAGYNDYKKTAVFVFGFHIEEQYGRKQETDDEKEENVMLMGESEDEEFGSFLQEMKAAERTVNNVSLVDEYAGVNRGVTRLRHRCLAFQTLSDGVHEKLSYVNLAGMVSDRFPRNAFADRSNLVGEFFNARNQFCTRQPHLLTLALIESKRPFAITSLKNNEHPVEGCHKIKDTDSSKIRVSPLRDIDI
ncbi:hypothetical protein AVEN_3644-1 [Araneus ventricosus]|uniref:Uncharacterized protein n=1 Tax=Araneus ventricosus TaxID=182803 RepID=A0A4Y2W319_ARAVE|nr:hypothetical protein AVEN_3644-1 [Araneus ventricosus]